MTMSAPTTNENESSMSTDRFTPWQYKWKKPHIAQMKSSTEIKQLADKIPISTTSARLKTNEIRTILQKGREAERQVPLQNNMKWEDLESESDEEGKEKEVSDDIDDGYIVTVTTFASRYYVEIIKKSKEDVVVPADAILIEVFRDIKQASSESDSDHDHDHIGRDEVETIVSKLLYWPSSALMDTNMECFGDSSRNSQVLPKEGDDGDLVLKDEDDQIQKESGNKMGEEILKAWNNLRSAFLSLPLDEMTPEQRQRYLQRQISHQVSIIKRKAGVKDIDLFRQNRGNETIGVDVDDAIDVLDRMTLGVGLEFDRDLLADAIGGRESNRHQDGSEEDSELMLSCLCNDDRVYIFSLLELLCPDEDVDLLKGNEAKFVGAVTGKGSANDTLIGGFEALLLGQHLANSLQNTFLPLSKPRASIDLTVLSIKGRVAKEDYDQTSRLNDEVPENTKDVSFDIGGFRPYIELSLFDANIESCTLHNRTINNFPTSCNSAFSYIVIGGKGVRRYRRLKEQRGLNESGQPKYSWENIALPGGFVSLISTKYYAEARTIFLPFEPKLISPVHWNSAELLIVMGDNAEKCVAIRTDSSSFVTVSRRKIHNEEGFRPTSGLLRRPPKLKRHFIKKFSPFRISFGDLDSNQCRNTVPISISSTSVIPASIVLSSLEDDILDIRLFSLDSFEPEHQQDRRKINFSLPAGPSYPNGVMRAKNDARHYVRISPIAHFDVSMDYLIQAEHLSFCQNDIIRCISGQGWSILGLKVLDKLGLFHISWEGATKPDGAFYKHIDTIEYHGEAKFCKISNICNNVVIDPPQFNESPGNDHVGLSCLRFGVRNDMNIFLSMRRYVVKKDATSPVQEVLDWLCEEKDYFTAASIALHLLGDKETIEDLQCASMTYRQCVDVIHREGLLDGITPLDIDDMQKAIRSDSSNRTQISMSSIMTYEEALRQQACISLSNIALTCLVNAGSIMSQTLDKFLGRNDFYDASIACQKLVDTSTRIIEALNASDMKHLAPYSYNPLQSDGHTLWAIQCLLRVAVTRERMDTALGMLNNKIPDELRHRVRRNSAHRNDNSYRSSLALSKSIISMILAASEQAASALMNLVEAGTNKLYWESLDHETRMSLSLIYVQGRYPMLREREVREWVLELLHIATGLIDQGGLEDTAALVPSDWLRELCTASLSNAGCDLSQTILFTPIISLSEDSSDQGEKDILQQRQEDEDDLYDYLAADPGCGGIDFDHLIPSLLLLESRNDHWVGNDSVSSQSILNIACDLAGRHSTEEPRFAFDSVSVMKQCVLMDNVLAAANLIGGRNGLVLKCAHVLMVQGGLTMNQSERYLLANGKFVTDSEVSPNDVVKNIQQREEHDDQPQFILTEEHKSLLWLIEKHVLSVKKYGDFHSKSRGHIDPVFAARICLRAWLFLMKTYPSSGQWLETWLGERLELNANDKDSKRLPYAALIRALLWSEDPSGKTDEDDLRKHPVLAMSLGFSMPFLVNLARVPCGLLECVPSKVVKEVLK